MRRVPRRVLVALISLIIAAAGAALAIDVVAVGTGNSPVVWPQRAITTELESNQWGERPIMAVAAATAVTGMFLLWAALSRGHRRAVRVDSANDCTCALLTRRGLRRSVDGTVGQVDGVDHHRVRLRGRRVKVKVTTPLRERQDLRERIADATRERLEAIRPAPSYKVTVKVRTARGKP
ncbi:DUF6286 domain-containing protein [Streptomyces sp. MK7]|uniref:DUF6286 domain-containing protein n=1 Tax=Streptomyces sp. MK7 TaxID=3067635 RepID=UPI002931655F|nr:DUF6286 domain-containing protein [Streptomyces sp. MK7]